MNEVFKTEHPLFKEINTKFLKLDSDKKNFDVNLNNDKTKLIITNNGKSKEYDVFQVKYEGVTYKELKYIHPDNIEKFDEEIIFRIIENYQQLGFLNDKIFYRCIFLGEIGDLLKTMVNQEIKLSFQQSIFKDRCNFNRLKINKTYFKNCIFLDKANFQESTLKSNENRISPFRYITFSRSVFLNEADFMFTKFESDADFENCIFRKASFSCLEFKQYISFDSSKFVEFLNLSYSKINNIILANANIKKLHLTDVEIKGSLNCDKIKLQKKENEEAFSILKENCIKKYNSISALYLHKKEVEEYRCTLDWKKNFIEKFILSFEKEMSDYGTNPFLPIFWFLPLHYIDYVIRDYDKKIYNDLENGGFNIYNLNIMEIIFNPSNPSNLLGFWFLIKLVLSSILIYEIIKSFRMFSRKL